MKWRWTAAGLAAAWMVFSVACNVEGRQPEPPPQAEAPPATQVEDEPDANTVKVDHPDLFPLATATARAEAPELKVTGTIGVDVSHNVPVISLASGRVVEIHAKLGDEVTKGQLLMRVQSADVSAAFADYRHATADRTLATAQLARARLLLEHGAVPQKDVEVAQATEEKARVDVETALERLKVLGVDAARPAALVDIYAPASGVIVEQNVTNAAGVKTLDNSPNLFTIADLSEVWVICDVYENDLASVRVGESAEVRLNAYPDRVFPARIANIGAILDSALRTAKVRLEVHNPGIMRLGMFVTATFHGARRETYAMVPASAILHLHDRDWVYVPTGNNSYRRTAVVSGKMAPNNQQEVLSGIQPGDRVVSNALVLQNSSEQ